MSSFRESRDEAEMAISSAVTTDHEEFHLARAQVWAILALAEAVHEIAEARPRS